MRECGGDFLLARTQSPYVPCEKSWSNTNTYCFGDNRWQLCKSYAELLKATLTKIKMKFFLCLKSHRTCDNAQDFLNFDVLSVLFNDCRPRSQLLSSYSIDGSPMLSIAFLFNSNASPTVRCPQRDSKSLILQTFPLVLLVSRLARLLARLILHKSCLRPLVHEPCCVIPLISRTFLLRLMFSSYFSLMSCSTTCIP